MTERTQDYPARLVYQPVIGFIEQVGSKSPAPGGGSVAALAGSLGASLLNMVINLTIDKKNYVAVAPRMAELRALLEPIRAQLTQRIDDDTAAFNRFRVANKLPERDEAERAAKAAEVAAATEEAIRVPESTMMLCLAALELAPEIADKGNVNTVSDAGTGAEMLLAGLEGAAANVLINLAGAADDRARGYRDQVAVAREKGRRILNEVRTIVSDKLGG